MIAPSPFYIGLDDNPERTSQGPEWQTTSTVCGISSRYCNVNVSGYQVDSLFFYRDHAESLCVSYINVFSETLTTGIKLRNEQNDKQYIFIVFQHKVPQHVGYLTTLIVDKGRDKQKSDVRSHFFW